MNKKEDKSEEARAAACVAFIRQTAREFTTKEFPKCKECGNQREEIETWAPEEGANRNIADHPILGYGWAQEERSIINPFRDETYSWTARALESIADALDTDGKPCDFSFLKQALDDWDSGEFADSHVNPYTAGLTAWLASNINNVAYLGEACAEFGSEDDGFKLLALAQYMALREHADNVRGAVMAYLEDEENKEV